MGCHLYPKRRDVMAHEVTSVQTTTLTPPPMTQPTTLRLTVPRQQAVREIEAALKIGQAIAGQRIRERRELDEARAEKQEWVQRTTELLTKLFNSSKVADRCNDWSARILPEYAPLEAFIELFEQEMEHRLGRLTAVLRRLDDLPDARTTTLADQPAPSSENLSPSKPMTTATHTPAPEPAPISAPKASPAASSTCCLLLNCGGDDAQQQSIRTFAEQLGLSIQPIARGEGASAIEAIDPNRQACFAIVLADSDAQTMGEHLFDLGFCAGRLGTDRICVMHAPQAPISLPSRLKAIAIDGGEGWQLQLARQLKRAGVAVDLNRLL